jgi:hypothetical protein
MTTTHQRFNKVQKGIKFKCDDRVTHPEFGYGVVIAIGASVNALPKFMVRFNTGRVQTFLDTEIVSAPVKPKESA